MLLSQMPHHSKKNRSDTTYSLVNTGNKLVVTFSSPFQYLYPKRPSTIHSIKAFLMFLKCFNQLFRSSLNLVPKTKEQKK